jgi:(2Fe-2S) ferredoxin
MKKRCRELGLKDIRINASGCLDRCEEGPCIVVYPEGVWYKIETQAQADEVIEKHLLGGEPVKSLKI